MSSSTSRNRPKRSSSVPSNRSSSSNHAEELHGDVGIGRSQSEELGDRGPKKAFGECFISNADDLLIML